MWPYRIATFILEKSPFLFINLRAGLSIAEFEHWLLVLEVYFHVGSHAEALVAGRGTNRGLAQDHGTILELNDICHDLSFFFEKCQCPCSAMVGVHNSGS